MTFPTPLPELPVLLPPRPYRDGGEPFFAFTDKETQEFLEDNSDIQNSIDLWNRKSRLVGYLEAESIDVIQFHYGPGPHPGTGTSQDVHGGDGVKAEPRGKYKHPILKDDEPLSIAKIWESFQWLEKQRQEELEAELEREQGIDKEAREERIEELSDEYAKVLADEYESFAFEHWNSLTEEQQEAIREYQNGEYGDINEYLREGVYLENEHYVDLIADSATPSPQDIMLYRGMETMRYEDLEAGDIITDDGFFSSSVHQSVAYSFIKNADKGEQEVAFIILVDEGFPIIPADSKDYPSEDEVILLPGTSFHVVDVFEDEFFYSDDIDKVVYLKALTPSEAQNGLDKGWELLPEPKLIPKPEPTPDLQPALFSKEPIPIPILERWDENFYSEGIRVYRRQKVSQHHYGPGPHPGTGTSQDVHGGDGEERTYSEVEKYMYEGFAKRHWETLTPRQKQVIKAYGDDYYEYYNGYARGQITATDYSEQVSEINSASMPAPYDMKVYRGTESFRFNDLESGDIFHDAGFFSTSIHKDIAADFADVPSKEKDQVVFEVLIPHAFPIIPYDSTDFEPEDEIFFPAGTYFEVKSSEDDVYFSYAGNVKLIQLEAIYPSQARAKQNVEKSKVPEKLIPVPILERWATDDFDGVGITIIKKEKKEKKISQHARKLVEVYFDFPTGVYRYIVSGRKVPDHRLHLGNARVAKSQQGAMKELTRQLVNGEINQEIWYKEMRQMMKDQYRAAWLASIGGRENYTRSEISKFGWAVRPQYRWLDNFLAELQSGKQPLNAFAIMRSGMYARAGNAIYQNNRLRIAIEAGMKEARRILGVTEHHCHDTLTKPGCIELAAEGWIPIMQAVPIGDASCYSMCLCRWEFR